MHVALRWTAVKLTARNRARISLRPTMHLATRAGLCAVVCCGTLFTSKPAAAADVLVVDAHLVADLEQRAMAANAKDQAFLYADLADKMTLLAGKQMADGDIEKAEATLEHLEACTARMESGLKDSKSLKKTELLLHTTNRRLSDLVRAASLDLKPQAQSALKRLNVAQESLLALIFAK